MESKQPQSNVKKRRLPATALDLTTPRMGALAVVSSKKYPAPAAATAGTVMMAADSTIPRTGTMAGVWKAKPPVPAAAARTVSEVHGLCCFGRLYDSSHRHTGSRNS